MTEKIKLGLKENWKQFSLLVLINAFVGGIIGLERSIFPQFAEESFGIASKSAILSFITAFGISKALANYFTGKFANRYGRRNLLLFFANVLLGISQGITWSSTVVMKIDLVGEKHRGLAMGLNEFAGYFAVGMIALLSGIVANKYGVTPYPFYIGMVVSILGFLITALWWVKDTRAFVQQEETIDQNALLDHVFIQTTFKHKTLSRVNQQLK